MERSPVLTLLIDTVDRPANAALTLGSRGLIPTFAEASLGLFGVAAATVATQLLLTGGLQGRVDGLSAFLEITVLLVPLTLMAAFLQVGVPLRALLGAVAVGLLQAGVVALTLLPLVAFTAVVSDLEAVRLSFPIAHATVVGLAVPGIAMMTLLERSASIVRSIDGNPGVARATRFVSTALAVAFLVRAWQLV